MAEVTIEDVASRAGVSIKTVSRVINRESTVREATRLRVEEAIKDLDYRPNPSARRLAGQRSFLIALLYDNPSPSYVTDNQEGVIAECRGAGYDLLINPCDYTNENLNADIRSFIRNTRIDGVIVTPPLSDIDSLIESLEESRIAFVCIARAKSEPPVDRVCTDDENLCSQMTTYLIDLGHRDIAFIKGHPDHKAVGLREVGFRRAMRDAGLVIREDLVIQGFNSFDSGHECGKKLLESKDPPSAIFAANDDMATGVIKAAYEKGLNIPRQLSVAGFDDVPLATQVTPSLTTVRQPIRDMAITAADILLAKIANRKIPVRLVSIEGYIIVRESTGVYSPGNRV